MQRSDAVVVAGSVHRGAHQHELSEFVTRHRRVLQDMPSAFVSVEDMGLTDWECAWTRSLATSSHGRVAAYRSGRRER